MSWINDEFNETKRQDERRQILQAQSARLWDELLKLLRVQVEEIKTRAPNHYVTIQERDGGVEIRNGTLPSIAIFVVVNWAAESVRIEQARAKDFFDPQRQHPKIEHLTLVLTPEDKLYVRGPNEDMLWPEAICKHILTPLVSLILGK
ncbi:MAG TPA: hypothetical protein VN937_10965 [Blastocatellia bacterium]|nr:hypothetical protein [Blastocatellia bacterium]